MTDEATTQRPSVRSSYLAASAACAIGTAVLAGWTLHIEPLKRFVPSFIPMNPVTACCMIVTGIALMLLAPRDPATVRKRVGQALACVVLTLALLRLVSGLTGSFTVDQWLFAKDLVNGVDPPSHISFRGAINLALMSLSLLLLDKTTAKGRRPAELMCLVAAILASLALVGYAYGLVLYYRAPDFVPMSLPGAIACLLIVTGTLLARPNEGAMRIICSDTPAGVLARLLLPLGVLLPVFLGSLRLAGEKAGWYSTRLGVALFATAFIVLFIAAVTWTTRVLFRSDVTRKAAEEHVRQLNAELEQRVAHRTSELTSVNAELQRASRAKDDFLAALSHELRTPLTPVLMSAAALERDAELAPEVREELAMIRRNVELEARLIDDLLDLTRIARGKLDLQHGAADVHSLLTHTEQIVRSEAQGKGIALRLALDAHHHVVHGDAARLHQVFWNMLKNAIKFTPSGGQVVVRTHNPAAGRMIIEVVDTGAGIDAAILPEIFGAFVQGDRRAGGASSGLGLGMSISKSIVELHGGQIRAASEGVGKGAQFTVELATDDALIAAVVSRESNTGSSKRSYRLLVVEDHQATLDVLARLLRKQGHEVETATSVEEAVHRAASGVFDLVISDIGLPDGNGIDLMVRLTRDHGLRGIALSGYGMDEDRARTSEAGFIAHLVKPIDFKRLHEVIEQFARAA